MTNPNALERFGNYDKKSLMAGIVVGQGLKGRARAPQARTDAPAGFPQEMWGAANQRANAMIAELSAGEASGETPATPADWQFDKEAFCFGVAAGRSLEGWEIDGGISFEGYGKIILYIHLESPDVMIITNLSAGSNLLDDRNQVWIDFGDGEFYHSVYFPANYTHSFAAGDYIVTLIAKYGWTCGSSGANTPAFYFASDGPVEWDNPRKTWKTACSVYCEGKVGWDGYAFYFSRGLSNVTLNQENVVLGRNAFKWSSIESVYITDLARDISLGDSAFSCCENLRSITFSKTPISVFISQGAFINCTALTSVNIPDGVTTIYYATFSGCHSLKSITIPDSIAVISTEAFTACTALSDVYYKGNEEQRNAIRIGTYGNETLMSATWHYNSTGPNAAHDD